MRRWRAGLLLAVCGVAATAGAVSYQGERALGQQFDLAARTQTRLLDAPEVVAYVSGIGARIAAALDESFFDYRFAVIADARVNAFAVPGGYVYVHSGLLDAVRSDDELAAVLGHEIAHVHARHAVRQQEQTQVLNYAALFGSLLSIVQPAVGSLATAASQAAVLQYQREFEQEADYLGARYMSAAGYDARAMLDFFQQLGERQRHSPNAAPPYLHTHPLSEERLTRLEAVLKTPQWAPRPRGGASPALRYVQALVRAHTNPPAEVLERYARERAAAPDDPLAAYLYGVVCLELGQLDAAAPALAAARRGGIEAADRELGRLALRQRDAERARPLLTAHLARQPDDAGAHVDLAKAAEALGARDAARASYLRALTLAPWLDSAQHGYGLLAGRAGQEGDGFYHLASAARLDGDYATALNQYARAVPLLPPADPRTEDARQWVVVLSSYLGVPPPP